MIKEGSLFLGNWYMYLLIAGISVGVILIILLSVFIIMLAKKNARNKSLTEAEKVDIIDGVRYTKHQKVLTDSKDISISHSTKDIILKRGKSYLVATDGIVIPGKYTILAVGDLSFEFNLRIGGFVREYKHNSNVVLSSGDEISAVSHDVILR